MEAKFSKPTNRLAWRVGDKGLSRAEAVSQAEKNLKSISHAGLAVLDENLDQLECLFAAAQPRPETALQDMYATSNAIAGVAGVFDLANLGRAAYSLCDLLAGFETSGAFNASAVRAHLDALRVLRRLPPNARAEAGALLANLTQLVKHMEQLTGGPAN